MRRALVLLPLFALLLPAPALAQGGPDAFGYTWDFTSYDWVDLSSGPGTLISGLSADDAETNVTLPFGFPYYGTSHSTIRVADNGGIIFASSGGLSYTNQSLPSTTSSAPDLAIYWDDIICADDVYSYNDTAGGRFIVSFEGCVGYYESSGSTGSFQVHLYPSGRIEYHYQDVDFGGTQYDNGVSATAGIQAFSAGTHTSGNALQVSYNATGTIAANVGILFESCYDDDGDSFSDQACGGTDCDDTNPAIFPGAVEVCGDGVDDDCDGADLSGDDDGDSYTSTDCGGDDCDDSDPAVNPGIDADSDGSDACEDCDDGDPTVSPSVDADSDGWDACEDCDDSDPNTYPGAAELCDALDNDCDGAPGSASVYTSAPDTTSSSGTGYFRGGKFEAASDTTIASFAVDLAVAAGATLEFGVYEATSESGTYNLVDSATVTAGSAGRQWHDSGLLSTPVTAGNWYVLGATWSGSGTFYYRSSSSASFPYSTTWGSHEGGASSNTFDGTLNAAHSFSTSATSYNIEVAAAGFDEADSDGDGQAACAGDCDDTDPLTFLGASEACDGIDNDCDSALPADELDADWDGVMECDGDCDDADATVYPGATELCDGLDNDCDGLGDGADADADGYLACEDCDDSDANTWPGATEICDGADNDCDGTLLPEEADADLDGVLICEGDCDDTNAGLYPCAPEI